MRTKMHIFFEPAGWGGTQLCHVATMPGDDDGAEIDVIVETDNGRTNTVERFLAQAAPLSPCIWDELRDQVRMEGGDGQEELAA